MIKNLKFKNAVYVLSVFLFVSGIMTISESTIHSSIFICVVGFIFLIIGWSIKVKYPENNRNPKEENNV